MLDVLMSKWNGLTPTGKAGVIGGALLFGGALYLMFASDEEEETVEQIPAQNVRIVDDPVDETTAEVIEDTEE